MKAILTTLMDIVHVFVLKVLAVQLAERLTAVRSYYVYYITDDSQKAELIL